MTEFTLRLPSLIAGVAYLIIAALLARRMCSTRLVFGLTLCALTLNPLVFDFLSAARGYGRRSACSPLRSWSSRATGTATVALASLALGGSVCANLAFAFPAAAL